MAGLGIRYGCSEQYSLGASVGRAIAWSFVGSWSLVFLGAGHGAGALPLPSFFAVLAKFGAPNYFLLSLPHIAFSPLVPIVSFLYFAFYTAKGRSSTDA